MHIMPWSRIFLTKTQPVLLMRSALTLGTPDSISFYCGVEKADGTWVWAAVVAFPLRAACCERPTAAEVLAFSLRSDTERRGFSLCIALAFHGVKPSVTLHYSLPPDSCHCWRPGRSWWSAAWVCSELGFSARTTVYSCAAADSLTSNSFGQLPPPGFDLHCSVAFGFHRITEW